MSAFDRLFVPDAFADAVSDDAWLGAMLEVEVVLARAEARAGLVPAEEVRAIEAECDPSAYDPGRLLEAGRAPGNPVEPLVREIRARVGGAAADRVHLGATSQDVLDSAAMLIARGAISLLRDELSGVAEGCAALAREHRSTPAMGRTLLQRAVPTTFGARAAGWLVGVLDARDTLAGLRFPAQLGGAAGTLAPLGAEALEVVAAYARELDLDEPSIPWHTHRGPLIAIGGALHESASACAKIGLDVVVLAQDDVGEVAPREGGRSSAMPHKRNPVDAVLARACARLAHVNASVLCDGEHELERAAGAWHAEWPALSAALAYAGGAAAAARACVEGLEVRGDRTGAHTGDAGSAEAFVDRALARYEG
ncbi:MAG TPA: lyase family protein [Gaiellaceae bacterium]|nr:lyase family protein [Gaiellaceae bacterium]